MPTIVYTLPIPLDGTGTEIPTLSTTDNYQAYEITGTVSSTGNYAIVATGTANLGMTYVFRYRATLDITTNGNTFSLFGQSITQAQLLKEWNAICYYNGSSWTVILLMDFGQSGIVSSSNIGNLIITNANIDNATIDACTKLVDLSVCTAKINDLAVTTGKIAALAVTDAKLAADSVTTVKILDDNVTNAKLADMADQTVKANVSGGAANPSDVAISTIINANAWGLTGNSGTVAGTNFIGTTDAVDLVFKANNAIVGRVNLSLFNTSLGQLTLASVTTGEQNTAMGVAALQDVTSGNENTSVGRAALNNTTIGNNNTAIGTSAGTINITGENNTYIGYNANADIGGSGANNRIAIGANAEADNDNQFALPDDVTELKAVGIAKIRLDALPAYDDNTAAAAALDTGEFFVTTGSGALARGIVCQVY